MDPASLRTEFEKQISDTESIVKKLEMTPIECVVRNITAGSIVRQTTLNEGTLLNKPLVF